MLKWLYMQDQISRWTCRRPQRSNLEDGTDLDWVDRASVPTVSRSAEPCTPLPVSAAGAAGRTWWMTAAVAGLATAAGGCRMRVHAGSSRSSPVGWWHACMQDGEELGEGESSRQAGYTGNSNDMMWRACSPAQDARVG